MASSGSYLSSHDHRVHAGVGAADEVRGEIRWPGGDVQAIGPLKVNGRYRVKEGTAPVMLAPVEEDFEESEDPEVTERTKIEHESPSNGTAAGRAARRGDEGFRSVAAWLPPGGKS